MGTALAPLTVGRPAPPDLVTAAAGAGFTRVGMTLWPPDQTPAPLCVDARGRRETLSRLDDSAVSVFGIGVIVLRPGLDRDRATRVIDAGRTLGADLVIVMNQAPDAGRAAARFAGICEVAVARAMRVGVEFMPYSATRTMAEAVDLVTAAGRPNGGLVVDLLHLYRSGGSVDALAELDPGLLHLLQICDARRHAPPVSGLRWEALHDRLYPGEGSLPVAAALSASPDAVPMTLEAPVARDEGKSVLGRARVAAAALRRLGARCRTERVGP